MSARKLAVTILALLSLGVVVMAMAWTRDMVAEPAVLPQERPMLPPTGVLSVTGEPILDRMAAREQMTNPLASSPRVLEQGKWLYEVYCDVCHGPEGHGDGPVGPLYPYTLPPLDSGYIQGYADGYMYSILREGGYRMPGYADALSRTERWMLVHYLRSFAD